MRRARGGATARQTRARAAFLRTSQHCVREWRRFVGRLSGFGDRGVS